MTTTPDQVLDNRQLACPMPIIKTAQALKGLDSGQTLLVKADDPGFAPDIKAWATRTGNELVSFEQVGEEFHALLRKA